MINKINIPAIIGLAGLMSVMGLAGNPMAFGSGAEPSGTKPSGARAVEAFESRELAQRLLEKIFRSYQNYNRGEFIDAVSDDFVPDKMKFVDEAEKSFYSAKPIQIDFFLDTVNLQGDKLAVSFTWNKKRIRRASGTQSKSQGHCLFVYKRSGENWLLYNMRESSPF